MRATPSSTRSASAHRQAYREGNPIPTQLRPTPIAATSGSPAACASRCRTPTTTAPIFSSRRRAIRRTSSSCRRRRASTSERSWRRNGLAVGDDQELLIGPVTLNTPTIGGADCGLRRRHAEPRRSPPADVDDACPYVPAGDDRSQVGDVRGHQLVGRHVSGAAHRQRRHRHRRHAVVGGLRHGAARISTPTTLTIANTDPVNSVTLTPPFAITGARPGLVQRRRAGHDVPRRRRHHAAGGLVPAGDAGSEERDLQVTSVQGGSRSIPLSGSAAARRSPSAARRRPAGRDLPIRPRSRASGGASPYTFTVSAARRHQDCCSPPDGTLAGQSDGAGTFTFTVQAAGANGCTGSATFTVSGHGSGDPVDRGADVDRVRISSSHRRPATQIVTLTNNTA